MSDCFVTQNPSQIVPHPLSQIGMLLSKLSNGFFLLLSKLASITWPNSPSIFTDLICGPLNTTRVGTRGSHLVFADLSVTRQECWWCKKWVVCLHFKLAVHDVRAEVLRSQSGGTKKRLAIFDERASNYHGPNLGFANLDQA